MTLESPDERLERLKAKHLALFYKHLPFFVLVGAILGPILLVDDEPALKGMIFGAFGAVSGGLEERIKTFKKERSKLRL